MGLIEEILTGFIRGLGMVGDAVALAIVAVLEFFLGEGVVPSWVGKLSELLLVSVTIWTVQRKIPRYLLVGSAVAALIIVFGGRYF